MNRVVFDASVLLAILQAEPFDRNILTLLPDAVISSVNMAEVLSKQAELQVFSAPAAEELFATLKGIQPHTSSQARICAALRPATRNLGLSLGDRCCLALAIELGAEVYTADHIWSQLNAGCRIHLIR